LGEKKRALNPQREGGKRKRNKAHMSESPGAGGLLARGKKQKKKGERVRGLEDGRVTPSGGSERNEACGGRRRLKGLSLNIGRKPSAKTARGARMRGLFGITRG